MMDISVVICTYNRGKSLTDTLDSLLKQECDETFDYEVIIVDNNSTDQTKSTVESFRDNFSGRLKYVFENQQGLSFARNRGVSESRGEIVAFTDDDAITDKKWLAKIVWCFQSNDCYAVGGKVLPIYPKGTPMWVKENKEFLSGPIVCHDYGNDTVCYNLKKMKPFIGANMSFKRECFDKYGLFRTDFGAGQKIGTGEDSNFFQRLEKEKIYYCGEAIVCHPVSKERVSFKYFAKYFYTSGTFYAMLEVEHGSTDKRFIYYFGIPRCYIKVLLVALFYMTITCLNRKVFLKYFERFFTALGEIAQHMILKKTFIRLTTELF